MRNKSVGAVLVGLALVVALVGTGRARAQSNAEPKQNRECSDATIEGSYGIQISGTRPRRRAARSSRLSESSSATMTASAGLPR